jgi:autotransporter-like protein
VRAIRCAVAGSLLASLVVLVTIDRVEAQATCGCPDGYPTFDPVARTCTGFFYPSFRTVPLVCRADLPIGQAAASLQQNSFSTVSGMLGTVRDRLQGSNAAGTTMSAVSRYSSADIDESFGLLGYASASRNPLMPLKAPPAASAPIASGPKWSIWGEGFDDWERRNPLNAADFGRRQMSGGAHAGVDAIWSNTLAAGDFVVFGAFGSWMKTKVNLVGPAAGFTLEGPGAGAYAMYVLGSFAADLTGKVDFLRLAEDFSGQFPNAFGDVTNAGLSGNIQYKNKVGASGYIEPTAGFSMTHIMFGDNAASLGVKDATTLRVQGGARLGATFEVGSVLVEPILGLFVYSNVVAEGTSINTTPIAIPIAPTDQRLVRGEVDPEINLDFNNGYSAYARAVFRFGGELFGADAKVGLRKQF